MKISTTSRHYDLPPALKDYAEGKIEHLETFFDPIATARLIFALEKYRHFFEVTLHVNGRDMVAHDTSEDMYASVDRVAGKLERQLLKHKGKLMKKGHQKLSELEVDLPEETDGEDDGEAEIIPADPIEFPQMTVDQAVEKLNMNGKDVSIFANLATRRVNVVYKREDGTIGIIEG